MALGIEDLNAVRERAGLFLDFDGSLAEIAPTPSEVMPAPGAAETLARLVDRFAIVAVVTGRKGDEVRAQFPIEGLQVFGVYGLEGAPGARSARPHLAEVERIAETVPGVWVEDKGVSITLHYRLAPDPDAVGPTLVAHMGAVADRHGLTMVEGKRAIEVASGQVPGKGAVIEGEVRSRELAAALYAGDDLADLDAFDALDRLEGDGISTVKVAVRSQETPPEITDQADLVVEGPGGLVDLLRGLAG